MNIQDSQTEMISPRQAPEQYTAHIAGVAARNLGLLQAIEETLDVLSRDTRVYGLITDTYAELQAKLTAQNGTATIDPDGKIDALLQASTQASNHIYADAQQRHQSACNAPELHDDDGVADAYAQYLAAIEAAHDAAEGLRQWILTHDAVLQPAKEGRFTSVDDLFNAMGI